MATVWNSSVGNQRLNKGIRMFPWISAVISSNYSCLCHSQATVAQGDKSLWQIRARKRSESKFGNSKLFLVVLKRTSDFEVDCLSVAMLSTEDAKLFIFYLFIQVLYSKPDASLLHLSLEAFPICSWAKSPSDASGIFISPPSLLSFILESAVGCRAKRITEDTRRRGNTFRDG